MAKGYSFFFGNVQLPVAPESMEMTINNQNTTINLINDQEVNILKRPGLTEITFDLLIPQVKYPFASYPNGFKDASYFLDIFEKLKTSLEPFQFIVSRALPSGKLLFDTNIKVSLEEYTIKEDAGEGFDLKVSVTLKQYVDYGTKTIKIKIEDTRVKPVVKTQTKRASSSSNGSSNKKPTIGCTVIVNGRLHRDSYGNGPGQIRKNYKGKINFIKTDGRKCPYHVTTPSGGWLGWVIPSAVKVV